MSLSSYKLNVSIAVSDMPRAKEFYEGKLGLAADRRGRTEVGSMRPAALPRFTSTHLQRVPESRRRLWPPGTSTTSSVSWTSSAPTA